MMDLDFTFDAAPWEEMLEQKKRGDSLSGMEFLSLTENEEDEAVEEIFSRLEEKGVALDISDLPANMGSGQLSLRLRQEKQLAESGDLLNGLEENDTLRLYLQELPEEKDLPQLQEQFLKGHQEAAEGLLYGSLNRIVEMAKGYTGRGVLLLDLIQEGSLGLWQGLQRYESGDFETHCRWWICQYFARAVLMAARSGDLMEKVRQGMEDYRDVDQRLLSDLGRSPTLEEIAQQMHVTTEEAEAYQDMISKAQSRQMVDTALEEKEETPEDEMAVEDTAYFQARERIVEMLDTLQPDEVRLLTLRFGLEGGRPLTPQEAGKELNLTPQELVEKEAKILTKLRQQGE